jgi:redox-regulated HSP33 family molecular chaperone
MTFLPAHAWLTLIFAGSVEVRCEYCGDSAQFSEADLQEVLQP